MKCMMKILLLVTAPVVIPSLATPGQTECQRQPHMCNMNQPLVAPRNEKAQVHVHNAARERHAACKLSQSCWRPARRGGRKSCTGGRKSCTASFTFHDTNKFTTCQVTCVNPTDYSRLWECREIVRRILITVSHQVRLGVGDVQRRHG